MKRRMVPVSARSNTSCAAEMCVQKRRREGDRGAPRPFGIGKPPCQLLGNHTLGKIFSLSAQFPETGSIPQEYFGATAITLFKEPFGGAVSPEISRQPAEQTLWLPKLCLYEMLCSQTRWSAVLARWFAMLLCNYCTQFNMKFNKWFWSTEKIRAGQCFKVLHVQY